MISFTNIKNSFFDSNKKAGIKYNYDLILTYPIIVINNNAPIFLKFNNGYYVGVIKYYKLISKIFPNVLM